METYRKAIHEVVNKGDVVADIGTGSGILALFAAQAGARKVYAVEKCEIIKEAEKLAEHNDLDEKIIFIKGNSDRVELPEKVDVITSELIGFFGIEENLPKYQIDSRKRFLKPGGRLVPSWLELYLVPVESETIWKDYIGLWNGDYYGFDFSPIRSSAVSKRYLIDCSEKVNQLATASMLSHINFFEIEKMTFVYSGKFIINKTGVLHGLVGYFRAGLSQSVVLSTSPEKPLTHWKQIFFPIKDAVKVENGDELFCKIVALPHGGGLFWQWETGVHRRGSEIARFSQSNLRVRREEFIIRQKDFKPILTQPGEIYWRVFDLCDGKRTVGEIAEILRAEYSEKYRDIKKAFEAVVGMIRGMVKIT
jgi:SAM-dependent methyltransferase